jgi:hypothetical protein
MNIPIMNTQNISLRTVLQNSSTIEAVMFVIVWWLDLQLPVQSVHIISNVVSSNPTHGEVY